MVTREREEHLNKVVVADSHTHRVRRHAEKLHHRYVIFVEKTIEMFVVWMKCFDNVRNWTFLVNA